MNAKKILVPTLILTVISLVITAVLVFTNDLTKDKIAQLQAEKEEAAKKEVLADADSFDTKELDSNGEKVTYYEASNGAGYVFSTSYKGYGGAVVVMTGISSEGEIKGVKITSQNETPGLGQKALDPSFTDQYLAAIPDGGFKVKKDDPSGQIDAIAGATITSRAVTNSVDQAIDLYKTITGGAN